MISAAVIEALKEIVPADKVLLQEPMKLHTTFRIGGPADCLVYLENEEQLCKIQKYLRLVDVPYTVIGNGSNLLVGDKGFRGTIISTERLAELEVQKNEKKPFRQIAATPLPHYKSLRRERGWFGGGKGKPFSRRFSPSKSPIPQTRA